MEFHLLIVGGGAAGLFAGARASLAGFEFGLLEGTNQCGRKLLTSGGGQCNLTRSGSIREFPDRYGQAQRFVRHALMDFDNNSLISFFHDNGLPCEDRGDGKVFPVSRKSSDVRDLLLRLCRIKGQLFWKQEVESIRRQDGLFILRTRDREYRAKKVILAGGGQSYPGTGSNGSAFSLAAGLGHTVTTPKPALTPVFIRNFPLVSSSGTALPVKIDLFRKGRKQNSFEGDLLITHKGFSGPVVLNNSRFMESGDELQISWIGKTDAESAENDLLERIRSAGKKSVLNGLAGKGLTEGLIRLLLERSGIDPDVKMSQISRKERTSLIKTLTADAYLVDAAGGFNQAMVTAGGVSLREVDPRTMESRLYPGLYFAGEVLDVDGETGGYNLQFAFSSAALAVKSILDQEKELLSSSQKE